MTKIADRKTSYKIEFHWLRESIAAHQRQRRRWW